MNFAPVQNSVSVHNEPLSPATVLRLAIVVSHPIQHFCPMYRNIASDPRVNLLVIFAAGGAAPRFDKDFGRVVKWQDDILEGYPYIVLTGENSGRPKAVLRELQKFSPHVVHTLGYHSAYHRAVLRWARRSGIATMLTTDSELLHARPFYVSMMKKAVLPRIFRDVNSFITVGDENERYFQHYGASRSRFHRVPFSIDSSCYKSFLSKRAEVRNDLRQQLGISPDTVAFLTVGKLIPRKAHAELIRAFALRPDSRPASAVLLIAGDGPYRSDLEQLAKPLGSSVRLLGFVPVQELPRFYLASDIYVHPSTIDPHPLAISEALYCGLPVVISDRVGSRGPTDDVQEGRNGWVYPSGDVEALSRILSSLIDDRAARTNASKISQELGALHASDFTAKLFVDAALQTASAHTQRSSDQT